MEENYEWKKLNEKMEIVYNDIEEKKNSLRNIPKNISVPYEFFKLFFDDVYLSQFIKNTNEYLHLKKKKANNEEKHSRVIRCGEITTEKIEKYLACEILMGIIIMPTYKYYWINDNIFKNSIRSI